MYLAPDGEEAEIAAAASEFLAGAMPIDRLHGTGSADMSAELCALFGEMGRSLLLGSCRAVPTRLTETGFRWMQPDLTAALRWELGRSG